MKRSITLFLPILKSEIRVQNKVGLPHSGRRDCRRHRGTRNHLGPGFSRRFDGGIV